jgi:hypothetical protein
MGVKMRNEREANMEWAAQIELEEIAKKWTGNPKYRVCSQCLLEVPRDTYNEHMQGHGYETLNVRYK